MRPFADLPQRHCFKTGFSPDACRPVVAAIKRQQDATVAGPASSLLIKSMGFMLGVTTRSSLTTELSRRALLRAGATAGCVLALGGCANLVASGTQFDASGLSAKPSLLVATTRKPVKGGRVRPWYGGERGNLSIARARLSPPDDGRFSLASMGLDNWQIESVEPAARIDDLLDPALGRRDVLVYVHGYNTTFEEATLDAARLSDGIKFHGETMVFTWPSRAKLLDYVYDRESAMWSRDSLERVLTSLMASPSVGTIHIVAHSVGTMLTLEALRQLYARGGPSAAGRIGAIVFAAPDIDMDVFASSIERLGDLVPKITVIAATNDRALSLSRFIAGGMTRVGSAEKAQLERLGLRVIDASHEGWGIINHDLFLSNADIRKVIRRAVDGRLANVGSRSGQPL
jgi:esterase/lipase superfamily enzyme